MFETFDIAIREFGGMVSPIAPVALVLGWQFVLTYMAIGYFAGSIPFAVIFSRLFAVKDVRTIGSGNVGASNMFRAGGLWPAVCTLICDVGKVALVVWFASELGPDIVAAAVIGAIFGHLFPVWLKFRGGKGVAVFFGAIWMVAPWAALIALSVWFVVFISWRYSSVASLIAVLVPPIALYLVYDSAGVRLFAFVALVIWIAHAKNLRRLMSASENRYSLGSPRNQ